MVVQMKAGLAPMHMWLPDSYGRAPATISLVLVSATLASLYGVLRVVFTLYGEALASIVRFDVTMNIFLGWFIIGLAVLTIIIGVIMALIQSDFKRLIAFSAVAEIGYMFLGIGAGLAAIGTAYGGTALKGGIFHIFNDALDVGLLFLVAGAVYYATKERISISNRLILFFFLAVPPVRLRWIIPRRTCMGFLGSDSSDLLRV